MTEAVTPPNPAGAGGSKSRPESIPDPTLLTIDALRREIAMLEGLVDTRLTAAEALTAERFKRIDMLIAHFEEQRQEQKADTKAAVDAALASQKEATSKMETSVSQSIAALRANFETEIRGLHSKEDDLKERMTVLESLKQGAGAQRQETRAITAGQIAAVGAAITILLAILTVIAFAVGTGT